MKKLPPYKPSAVEEEMLQRWQTEQTFAASLEKNKDAKQYTFYDGPPFANGLPHFGHSLVTAIKDSIGRYKTMRGYYVSRRNGWDCHGLPVEFEIEKKFGISGKKQIMELGIDKFNQACRDSVFTYKTEWEQFFNRIGRWSDTEHAYATIDRDYTESVWWAFAQIYSKGLIYRGFKNMPYCPRCATPLSNFELNEGYRDDVPDPSLYVKFKLASNDVYLLAWTTTPWSLPGNAAIAVDPDAEYVQVSLVDDAGERESLILARKRLVVLDQDYEIEKSFKGSQLVGKKYQPLFDIEAFDMPDNIYQIWPAEFVSTEDGTGVLHVAPAFGEDDLALGQAHGLPVISSIGPDGKVKAGIGIDQFAGLFFKSADKPIIEQLTKENKVFAAQTENHTYPFCYRCDSPLLYYAVSTWFIAVSKIKDKLLSSAEQIEWTPSHIKHGRFGQWLQGARDWAISRNRYWGAPMPIWQNVDDENDLIVIESIAQLRQLAGDVDLADLHRPYIDKVEITKDGKTYRRIEEVLDCWFESGSMPYGQAHYPFENKENFNTGFPADYIGEGLDQTRLWFYVLHVVATILFDKPAYRHVLVNGMVMAADGQKLSKRLKNYPPIEDVFSAEGADSLRFYLLSSTPAMSADYMRFSRDSLRDVNRNVFMTLYNSAGFLSMYAEVDKWTPEDTSRPINPQNILDRWLIARVDQAIKEVTNSADKLELARAIAPIQELVDDISNWYIRRSRRRFWKSDNDEDKLSAYKTLHWALVTTCQLLAPWSPMVSDYLYLYLSRGVKGAAKSVHLTDWPVYASRADQSLLTQMSLVRDIVTEALSARASAGIKVRQPLSELTIKSPQHLAEELLSIIADEVNVKKIVQSKSQNTSVQLNTKITQKLKYEGIVRDLIRHIQSVRKQIDLNIDDRIVLFLNTQNNDLEAAIKQFEDVIKKETLALSLDLNSTTALEPQKTITIENNSITIAIKQK